MRLFLGVKHMKKLSKNVVKSWWVLWIFFVIIALIGAVVAIKFMPKPYGYVLSGCIAAIMLWWAIYNSIRYEFYSYLVNDERVQTKRGVFFRHNDIVPIIRVQHIELSQGPIDRIFKVAKISLFTVGTNHEIIGIDEAEAKEIVETIKNMVDIKAVNEAQND